MSTYLAPILLGIVFGFVLVKGGLTKYGNIVGVFRFTNLTVIKFMMTALVVSMIGLYTLQTSGAIQFPNIPGTYVLGNRFGGLIFGVGMALAGYCPGTVVAGAGEGKLDYLFSGLGGLLTGALLFGFTYNSVFPPIAKVANLGNITLPTLLGVHPLLVVALFVVLTLLLFYFLENGGKRKDKLSEE